MEKKFIKNRQNKKIVVLIEKAKNAAGLAFVMHGLGGFKEQPHIETIAKAFQDKDYTVVRFDTTNTLGESDGEYENATLTNYYQDLEDVITWASKQPWYREPFVLAGHSLGSISIALYAQKFPQKLKAVAPLATVVSGRLSLETYPKRLLKKWQESGWVERESSSKPGVIKKFKWSYMNDQLRYDLLKSVDKLTVPVLLIVGSEDERTPLKHQKILYNALPGPKELHVIEGSGHTFRAQEHLDKLYHICSQWIAGLE